MFGLLPEFPSPCPSPSRTQSSQAGGRALEEMSPAPRRCTGSGENRTWRRSRAGVHPLDPLHPSQSYRSVGTSGPISMPCCVCFCTNHSFRSASEQVRKVLETKPRALPFLFSARWPASWESLPGPVAKEKYGCPYCPRCAVGQNVPHG